jgi:hypothetical protein
MTKYETSKPPNEGRNPNDETKRRLKKPRMYIRGSNLTVIRRSFVSNFVLRPDEQYLASFIRGFEFRSSNFGTE